MMMVGVVVVVGGEGEGRDTVEEDIRREDIAQERILVPDQRQCLCELSLRIGVVLEGLGGGGGSHGCLLGRESRGLLRDGTEEGTH